MRFLEMQESYFYRQGQMGLGSTLGTITANDNSKAEAKRNINSVIQELETSHDFPWSREEWRVKIITTYETGTVTGSAGSTTLTGSGTSWTSAYDDQLLVVPGAGDGGDEHRIRAVNSATSIELENPLVEAVAAGSSYSIYTDVYKFPRDMNRLYTVRQLTNPRELRQANAKSPAVLSRLLYPSKGQEDLIDLDFRATTRSLYSTGAVSVNNGATTVTGAGGADFTAAGIADGEVMRIGNDNRTFEIRSVTNATTLELNENYVSTDGANVTGASYVIDPPGIRRFRVLNYVENTGLLVIEGRRRPKILVADADRPDPIPEEYHHSVIVTGAVLKSLIMRGVDARQIAAEFANNVRAMEKGHSATGMRHGSRIRSWAAKTSERSVIGEGSETALEAP